MVHERFQKKLSSRTKTLLLPYLFWNTFTLSLYALTNLPAIQIYFSGANAKIIDYGLFDYLNALFGFTEFPVAYQFWFIRDLMVMCLLAPLVYLLTQRVPKLFLLIVLTLWYINYWPVYIPSAMAFAFFYTGAFAATAKVDLFSLDRYSKIILPCYIATLFADAITKDSEYSTYLHHAGILLGIPTALFLSKFMQSSTKLKPALTWLAGTSFFVFALHEPFLSQVQKALIKIIQPQSEIIYCAIYFTIPLLIIGFCLCIHKLLSLVTPRLLNAISGDR